MITLNEFETATGITDKSERIEALIPIVENHIKGYCNIDEVPEDYHVNAIDMISYQLNKNTGVQSESLSRHSVTYTNANEYPKAILKGMRRRLRW